MIPYNIKSFCSKLPGQLALQGIGGNPPSAIRHPPSAIRHPPSAIRHPPQFVLGKYVLTVQSRSHFLCLSNFSSINAENCVLTGTYNGRTNEVSSPPNECWKAVRTILPVHSFVRSFVRSFVHSFVSVRSSYFHQQTDSTNKPSQLPQNYSTTRLTYLLTYCDDLPP